MASHQDWKPLVLGKAKPTQDGKSRNANDNAAHNHPQSKSITVAAANLRRLDEDVNDDYRIPQVNMEMGRKIVSGRLQLKLSQEQLAKKCSIPLAIIKDYEQGKGIYNRAYLDPICRLLNIVVSKQNSK